MTRFCSLEQASVLFLGHLQLYLQKLMILSLRIKNSISQKECFRIRLNDFLIIYFPSSQKIYFLALKHQKEL